ncbi:MAG: MMPL family transporter, partial [Balneolaceae bacterium]|nr:MMPL family transporter [Balneolaceae bacterium]
MVLAVSVTTAIIAGYFALQLKVDTDLANLLPKKNEHVIALEKLQETVGGETAMEVAIKSPSFEDNRRFAQDLIDRSMALFDSTRNTHFFERAEFRKETEVLRNNALYFATPNEIRDITTYLQDEIQAAKEEANPFYIDFGEEEEEEEDTTGESNLSRFEESYENLIPSEYPMSPDSTVMLLKFYPTGSKSDLSYLERMFSRYDSLLAAMQPATYNKEMEVRFGGRLKRHLSEINSVMEDVFSSFASGISSVVLLVVLYFFFKKYINYRRGSRRDLQHGIFSHILRMPVPFFIIGIPLIISLTWTFGITYGVLGMLNTMTSVLFVILFGMGIDYGIHFYARYIEFRSSGMNIMDAMDNTYDKTGSAIVVSGLTTAFSLFVLIVAKFRGFSEFGFIAGTGIILALFCMLFVMPSLLVLFEKFDWILLNEREEESTKKDRFHRFPYARSIVTVGLLISIFVIFNSGQLRFQYDFGELEPEYPEYEAFRDFSDQVTTSDKRNPAYILADNQEQVMGILEKLRHKMRTDTTSPTIRDVEALPERFPVNDEAAQEKLEDIAQIRQLLDDPFLRNKEDPQLDKLRRAAQTMQPMDMDEIPDYFKDQFMNKEGEV